MYIVHRRVCTGYSVGYTGVRNIRMCACVCVHADRPYAFVTYNHINYIHVYIHTCTR